MKNSLLTACSTFSLLASIQGPNHLGCLHQRRNYVLGLLDYQHDDGGGLGIYRRPRFLAVVADMYINVPQPVYPASGVKWRNAANAIGDIGMH